MHIQSRQEYEADHLGLLLLAATGYDPRIAPSMYAELAELEEMYSVSACLVFRMTISRIIRSIHCPNLIEPFGL
jgi:predicted Zn-dependent protease